MATRRQEQRSTETSGWPWRKGQQHTCGMFSATVNPLSEPYSRRNLIKWWETRRLWFNLFVGAVGVVTWILVLFVGSLAVKPGEDVQGAPPSTEGCIDSQYKTCVLAGRPCSRRSHSAIHLPRCHPFPASMRGHSHDSGKIS